MIETLPSQPNAPADDVLRLKCPSCGGGLNLKRRFLGVKGQCVHCQIPLMAVEEDGVARVITDAPAPPVAELPMPAAPVETPTVAHAPVPLFPTSDPAPRPALETTTLPAAPTVPTSTWGFPDFASPAAPASFPTPQPEPAFKNLVSPELAPPLPSRDGDDLFSGRNELPAPSLPSGETKVAPSPFGDSGGFSLSSSLFGSDDSATAIAPAWGTNVPRETHASISPFSTGSAEGGGFAESLFREKVVKDAGAETGSVPVFASPFAPMPSTTVSAPASPDTVENVGPKRDCQEFVILDGDGRPMRPMSKEEEEEFAKNFFKYDNARTKPTWLTRLRKKVIRMLIFFCIISAIGAGASFFVPKETLLVWKEKVIKWLEPGMAILDYLPEKLRPDWLPQTDFGIDAGVDENGKPKKKMNAFEGLDKLKGDIGNMRGAADKQLEELKNF